MDRESKLKREVFIVQNPERLFDIISSNFTIDDDSSQNSAIGVGFYQAIQAQNLPGIEIHVTPAFLKAPILELVEKGQFDPCENEIFLWADEKKLSQVKGINKWLVTGLSIIDKDEKKTKENYLVGVEKIRNILTTVFKNVLELRPGLVVFMFDVNIFLNIFSKNTRANSFEEFFHELLLWLVEDCIHPNVLIYFKSESEFLLASQKLRQFVNAGRAYGVSFKF